MMPDHCVYSSGRGSVRILFLITLLVAAALPTLSGETALPIEEADIAPTNGPAWPTDLVNGDHFSLASSSLSAISGYPNVTVPMGDIHGLPVGLSIFGIAFTEPVLLRIAYAFERETKARKKPEFLPTLVLE